MSPSPTHTVQRTDNAFAVVHVPSQTPMETYSTLSAARRAAGRLNAMWHGQTELCRAYGAFLARQIQAGA